MLVGGRPTIGDTPTKVVDSNDFCGGTYTVVLRVGTRSETFEVFLGHAGMTSSTDGLYIWGGDAPLILTIQGEDLYAVTNQAGGTPLSFLAYSS